jgi:hypothetical protein
MVAFMKKDHRFQMKIVTERMMAAVKELKLQL